MPSTRRTCLVGVAVVFAGCTRGGDDTPTETDTRTATPTDTPTLTDTSTPSVEIDLPDCRTADRPEYKGDNEFVSQVNYPDPPASFEDRETVVEYIKVYENAYRHNLLLVQSGRNLRQKSVYVGEGDTRSTPAGWLVWLDTEYNFEVQDGDGLVAGDVWSHPVLYYVDDTIVVRTEDEVGAGVSDLRPRELEKGRVVECFK